MKGRLKSLGVGTILWLASETLVWLLLVKNYLNEYGYRFIKVTNVPAAWASIFLVMLLPLILLLLATIFLWKGRKSIGQICLSLVFSAVVIGFFFHGVEMLFFPPVCSYTMDAEHFGQYDKRVERMLSGNPAMGFPEEIPEEARDVKYRYFYMNASAEDVYIAVSWRYDDEEAFALALAHCQEEGTQECDSDEELAYYFFGSTDKNIRSCFNTAIIFDNSTNRVYYALTNDPETLPRHGEEVFVYLEELDASL